MTGCIASFRESTSSHGDLCDLPSLIHALELARPQEVYNLAATSFVGFSWQLAELNAETTPLGALRMLGALRTCTRGDLSSVRYYQASTSEVFGAQRETPQTEETPFHPRAPYGVAKALAHNITVNYRESYGAFACCGILFNHESQHRGHEFVTRKVTSGVARIALGLHDHLQLGSLDSTHDPSLLRPSDSTALVGDASKAAGRLGWKPTVAVPELIARMVSHDLEAERGKASRGVSRNVDPR